MKVFGAVPELQIFGFFFWRTKNYSSQIFAWIKIQIFFKYSGCMGWGDGSLKILRIVELLKTPIGDYCVWRLIRQIWLKIWKCFSRYCCCCCFFMSIRYDWKYIRTAGCDIRTLQKRWNIRILNLQPYYTRGYISVSIYFKFLYAIIFYCRCW